MAPGAAGVPGCRCLVADAAPTQLWPATGYLLRLAGSLRCGGETHTKPCSLQHLKWHCVPNPNDRTPQPQRVHATFAHAQEPLPSIDVPVRDLGNFEWENPRVPPPPLDFDNAEAAFAAHSSLSIMRSLAVFSLCSIRVGGSRRTRLHVHLFSSLQARSRVHLTLHVHVTVAQICPWKITK